MQDELTVESSARDGREASRALMLVSFCLFLLSVIFIFHEIRARNDGHLVYALDDAYIHLALSEQIAHGHYGINPGEPSSPSSSLLWPLLLVPLAGHPAQTYLPLLLNVVFGSMTMLLLAYAVGSWRPRVVHPWSPVWWTKLATVMLLMFVGNLVSLTFIGMEHVLQVLLAVGCAVGLMSLWEGRRIPPWCLAAAVIAPMVRYEDLSLTLAMSIALAFTDRKVQAALVLVAGTLPLALFGLFLHHLGLPVVPISVLMKANNSASTAHWGDKMQVLLQTNFHLMQDDPSRWPMLALGVILCFFWVCERDRARRAVLRGVLAVTFLQIVFGRFGWFGRYEVYALIFATLMLGRAANIPRSRMFGPFALGLFYLAAPYINNTMQTPQATHEIYRQQVQMRRFMDDFYRESTAVNDIGLMSYRHPANVYILDVDGLASLEAATTDDRSAAWLQAIVERHDTRLAILFPAWFHIPTSWVAVGRMCNADLGRIVAGGRCVDFYSTRPSSAAEIRDDLARFVPTLPAGVTFEFDPPPGQFGIDPSPFHQ
jgi:hypothetical protein